MLFMMSRFQSSSLCHYFHSNPRFLRGERLIPRQQPENCSNFNPHSPSGSDNVLFHGIVFLPISIHALQAGSDTLIKLISNSTINFNPRSPARGATRGGAIPRHPTSISIHAPRAGSDNREKQRKTRYFILIHAPRAGSDLLGSGVSLDSPDFNPRSPRGERRRVLRVLERRPSDFNPRSPRGERQIRPRVICSSI